MTTPTNNNSTTIITTNTTKNHIITLHEKHPINTITNANRRTSNNTKDSIMKLDQHKIMRKSIKENDDEGKHENKELVLLMNKGKEILEKGKLIGNSNEGYYSEKNKNYAKRLSEVSKKESELHLLRKFKPEIEYQSFDDDDTNSNAYAISEAFDEKTSKKSSVDDENNDYEPIDDKQLVLKFGKFVENHVKNKERKSIFQANMSHIEVPSKNDPKKHNNNTDKIEQNLRVATIVKGISKKIDFLGKGREGKFEDKMKIFNALPSFINIAAFIKDMNLDMKNKTDRESSTSKDIKYEHRHSKAFATEGDLIDVIEHSQTEDLIERTKKYARNRKSYHGAYFFDNMIVSEVNKLLEYEKKFGNVLHDDNAENRFYDDLVQDLMSERFVRAETPMQKVEFDTEMHDRLTKIVNMQNEKDVQAHVKQTAHHYEEFKRRAEKITNVLRKIANKIMNRDGFGLSIGQARIKKILNKRPGSPDISSMKASLIKKLSPNDHAHNGLSGQSLNLLTLKDLTSSIIGNKRGSSHSISIMPNFASLSASPMSKYINQAGEFNLRKNSSSSKDKTFQLPMIYSKLNSASKKTNQSNENFHYLNEKIQNSDDESNKNSFDFIIPKLINSSSSTLNPEIDTGIMITATTNNNITSHDPKSEYASSGIYLTSLPDPIITSSPTLNTEYTQATIPKSKKTPLLPQLKLPKSLSHHQPLSLNHHLTSIKKKPKELITEGDYIPKKHEMMMIRSHDYQIPPIMSRFHPKSTRNLSLLNETEEEKGVNIGILNKKKSLPSVFNPLRNNGNSPKKKQGESLVKEKVKRQKSEIESTRNLIAEFINKIDVAKTPNNKESRQQKTLKGNNSADITDHSIMTIDKNCLDILKNPTLKQSWKNRRQYNKKMLSVFLSS